MWFIILISVTFVICFFLVCFGHFLFVIIFDYFFFFEENTEYEWRISDWSSDVCSSDLCPPRDHRECEARFPRPRDRMMLAQMDEVQARLNTLVSALDGHDAGAIIAATEDLATAVILFRGATIPAGSEHRARALIGQTLNQLEAAAVRVNILKN